IKSLLKLIGRPIDIIWSFDLNNLYPFKYFPASALKVFHPVDEPLNKPSIEAAKGAAVIFSVTKEILQKYAALQLPGYLVNHGLPDIFLKQEQYRKDGTEPLRVGYSGNMMRPDIDRPILLQIIKENPEIIFECWGSYNNKQTNIGGSDTKSTSEFIAALAASPNVILHGAVNSTVLAKDIQRMDGFLICYDIEKDQSKGTNYHKVMEYLSTGKVIISNNISAYQGSPELVCMIAQRDNNGALPMLFKKVTGNLMEMNNIAAMETRKLFAAGNTYKKQIETIEALLDRN
ncbi:MAG: hypothetical protein ABJC98_22790, partial [Bacteroidota bacterium]